MKEREREVREAIERREMKESYERESLADTIHMHTPGISNSHDTARYVSDLFHYSSMCRCITDITCA